MSLFTSAVGTALVVAPAAPATSSTIRTFSPSTGNVWSEPGNWSPVGVPADGDSVRLAADSYDDLPGLQVHDLTATAPARVAARGDTTLSIDGDITVERSATAPPGSAPRFDTFGFTTMLNDGLHVLDVAADTRYLAGPVSGPGGFVKRGGGSTYFQSADFAGSLDIEAGHVGGVPGSPAGGTVLRRGTSLDLLATSPSHEPLEIHGGVAAAGTELILHGAHDGPVEIIDGVLHIGSSSGSLSGPISGPGALLVDGAPYGGEPLRLDGENSFSGGATLLSAPLDVGGSSPLGTGPVVVHDSRLGLRPQALVTNSITATGTSSLLLADDGWQEPPEVAGPIRLESDMTVRPWLTGQPQPGTTALGLLSGPLSGPGVLVVADGQEGQLALVGDDANTNAGVRVSGSAGSLLLGKTPGRAAVTGSLQVEHDGTVTWTDDDQVDDHADASIGAGATTVLAGWHDALRDLTIARNGRGILGAVDGTATGRLEVRSLLLAEGSAIEVTVDGTEAGQVAIEGSESTIDGADLDVVVGQHPPAASAPLTVVAVPGTAPIKGTFRGLPEGAAFESADGTGALLTISYRGGDGNDVTVTPRDWGYVPMSPRRILETRAHAPIGWNGKVQPPAGSTLPIDVSQDIGIPADAAGVVVNLTVTNPTAPGYLTVWPCSRPRPLASNVNFVAGQTVANLVIAQPDPGGRICIYNSAATDVIADVAGWLPSSAAFETLTTPLRILDTRPIAGPIGWSGGKPAANQTVHIDLTAAGVPDDAVAVAINVTAAEAAGPGWVVAWPCALPQPPTSNLNLPSSGTVANLVIVPTGVDRTICLRSATSTHLIADLQGWLGPDPHWVTAPATRLLDTRETPGVKLLPGVAAVVHVDAPGGGSDAAAAILNVTVTEPDGVGHVTAWPCDEPRPLASNVNFVSGQTVPNLVVTKLDAHGDACIMSVTRAHVVVDLQGWVVER